MGITELSEREINRAEYLAAVAAAQARGEERRPVLVTCKAKGCREVRRVFEGVKFQVRQNTFGRPVTHTVRPGRFYTADGEPTSSRDLPCGHGHADLRVVDGTYKPEVECNARCLNARTGSCECSCGGARHGENHG